ncbi:MAG: transcriptional regulator [Pirellulaceae bacterium]|nr:transcriptional regulator [Pirellulaceae bacterium]
MARNEQLIRQHKILQILERTRFGRTLEEVRDELVEELGLTSLHTRSVRRDLEALQAAGIDIVSDSLERGRVWKLGPRARGTLRITASATELTALSLSRDLLYPLAGTPFWQGIESFWNKIRDELPDSVWQHYQKYRRFLHVMGMPAKSYEAHQGILKTINRAILEHRVVEIHYHSLGKPVAQRLIEPYAVVFYHSSLYIVAALHDSSSDESRMRHWKLDRFQKATALDQWFKPDPAFDVERHLGQSVGIFASQRPKNFKIRISSYAAPWVVEDPWHPQQQIERQPDGSIVLSVQAAHELEIIPRVLALGAEAELLAPESCRKTLAGIIGKLAEIYGGY